MEFCAFLEKWILSLCKLKIYGHSAYLTITFACLSEMRVLLELGWLPTATGRLTSKSAVGAVGSSLR